jgi:hypothetical protein
MILAVALGGFTDDAVQVAPKPDLTAYDDASAHAGKSADAHIRLALWCEARGLTAERVKHLALAVLYDPANVLARGLLGLVAYHGKWDRPDAVGRRIANDPVRRAIINEYLDRRAHTPDKADAQMKLAAWCDENGLKEQALAHYTAVTQLDPARDTAWKHLGYKKQGNRWVKPEEAAAAKQEAARQKQADKHWRPKLEKLRDGLESKDAAKRAKAEQGLTEVTDPRAVPMIWALFARGGPRAQIAAVQVLGQIDGPSASNGLAVLAVFSPRAEVRRRATEALARRDPRDVVWRLIGLLHKPYGYQVRHVNGPAAPGELFVEGERFNLQRFYRNLTYAPAIDQGRMYSPDVPFDPFSARNIILATMGPFTTNPAFNVATPGKPNYSITFPSGRLPQSAAMVGQEMSNNPPNATAILGQLVNNPATRYAPPGFWSTVIKQANTASSPHGPATVNPPENHSANVGALPYPGSFENPEAQAAERDLEIGRGLEAIRQANQDLEQRLAMDVQFVEATNIGINLFNDRTLPVLTAITGQDLGIDPEKWKRWWTDQLGYSYQSDLPETKPTYTDFVTEGNFVSSYVHSACFAGDTLVQTSDGPRPIRSIRTGDLVLSQSPLTGMLGFQPVVATHRNEPSPTLRIAISGESIVATGIHRFWKAGQGWAMARELKAGDRLRILGGTVAIDSIATDRSQPVYNLDVAENRDFFVGARGLLVHDFSFVQPVVEPFDHLPEPSPQAPSATR